MTPRLGVIVLTYNEEVHIERCIASVSSAASCIYVVDSGSEDRTVSLARARGGVVAERKWDNYSKQFQFAIDTFPEPVDWILRLDADEYVDTVFNRTVLDFLGSQAAAVGGVEVRRKMMFLGRWIRHGGMHPLWMCRLWRSGMGRIEDRWMDEHMIVEGGSVVRFPGSITDENLRGLAFWTAKHNSYSDREVLDIIGDTSGSSDRKLHGQAGLKRKLKGLYLSLPPGLRALCYWFYRYFFLLGFLDGTPGFFYHLFQALWYRSLVDAKLLERKLKAEQLSGLSGERFG